MRSRTPDKVTQEYDAKWGRLLAVAEDDPTLTVEQLYYRQFHLEETYRQTRTMLRMALLPYADQVATYIELGCGWGLSLAQVIDATPCHAHIGGELTEAGCRLAQRLNPTARIVPFNFYEPTTYQFLETVKPPYVIYTHHAIEQLPSCAAFIKGLRPYHGTIHAIVHMEPLYDYCNTTPAGKRQRQYLELNHYNQDLLEQVEAQGDILRYDRNIMAANPLNPTSLLVWRFPHA